MKSPAELKRKLSQDWQQDKHRQTRAGDAAFPVQLAIGLPRSRDIGTQAVRDHLAAWQAIDREQIGTVIWQTKKYRACDAPINCPAIWQLNRLKDWHDAMDNAQTQAELAWFIALRDHGYLRARPPLMAREQLAILLRHKALALPYGTDTIVHLLILADILPENVARGLPLRALTWPHIMAASVRPLQPEEEKALQTLQLDSKFFERHHTLLGKLLGLRFGSRVADSGLSAFLGAEQHGGWIRLCENHEPRSWLNFAHIRVPGNALQAGDIPLAHILIIENEQCLHLLPPLADTLIILGAGRNLAWLAHPSWQSKHLYYWGDLDSWGLEMLSTAQSHQPHIRALMMDQATLHRHITHAVSETHSYPGVPLNLNDEQTSLFTLLQQNALRLEQEFIDKTWVEQYCRDSGLPCIPQKQI